jgi:tRNA1Val (adenine37-N6)-methyltransferase
MRRAIAKHELMASVDDILHAARNILREKGRLAMIYPAERLVGLVARMRRFTLEPKRIQINYPDLKSSAKLALIEASLGGRPGLEILPPLIGQGNYSV